MGLLAPWVLFCSLGLLNIRLSWRNLEIEHWLDFLIGFATYRLTRFLFCSLDCSWHLQNLFLDFLFCSLGNLPVYQLTGQFVLQLTNLPWPDLFLDLLFCSLGLLQLLGYVFLWIISSGIETDHRLTQDRRDSRHTSYIVSKRSRDVYRTHLLKKWKIILIYKACGLKYLSWVMSGVKFSYSLLHWSLFILIHVQHHKLRWGQHHNLFISTFNTISKANFAMYMCILNPCSLRYVN